MPNRNNAIQEVEEAEEDDRSRYTAQPLNH